MLYTTKQVFTFLIFCPKSILFIIRLLNRRRKDYQFVNCKIGEINKIAIIDNPYAKSASLYV
jgi:hypothetical protein